MTGCLRIVIIITEPGPCVCYTIRAMNKSLQLRLALVAVVILAGCSGGGSNAGLTVAGALFVTGKDASGNPVVRSFNIRNNGIVWPLGSFGYADTVSVGANPKDLAYDDRNDVLFVASGAGRIDQISVGNAVGDINPLNTVTIPLPAPSGRQHEAQSLEVLYTVPGTSLAKLLVGTEYYKSVVNTDAGDLYEMPYTSTTLSAAVNTATVPMYHSGLAAIGSKVFSLSEGNQGLFSMSTSSGYSAWTPIAYPPSNLRDVEASSFKNAVYACTSSLTQASVGSWNGTSNASLGSHILSVLGRTDVAISRNSAYLYAVGTASQKMDVFSVAANGSLTPMVTINLGFTPGGVAAFSLTDDFAYVTDTVGKRIVVYSSSNAFASPVYTLPTDVSPERALASRF